MLRTFRNVSFAVLALAIYAAPARTESACLAPFGGDSRLYGDPEEAIADCNAVSSGCESFCFSDFGTGSLGNYYGCQTAQFNNGYWNSYGNCNCACEI